jgi:hypothetical protein
MEEHPSPTRGAICSVHGGFVKPFSERRDSSPYRTSLNIDSDRIDGITLGLAREVAAGGTRANGMAVPRGDQPRPSQNYSPRNATALMALLP